MSAKTAKKITKNIREIGLCWSYIICRSFSGWGAHFPAAFEELALKKAANNEVATLIQKYLTKNVGRTIL